MVIVLASGGVHVIKWGGGEGVRKPEGRDVCQATAISCSLARAVEEMQTGRAAAGPVNAAGQPAAGLRG